MSVALPRWWAVVPAAVVLLLSACADLDGLAGGGGDGPAFRDPDAVERRGDRSTRPGQVDLPEVSCGAGRQTCGTACVDLSTDPDNCGRCGHGCLGGACNGGVCQPITLASGLAIPKGLVVGPDGVYVTLFTGQAIVRVPKDGGEVETVTQDTRSPAAIAAVVSGGKTTTLVWGEARGSLSDVTFCELPCTEPRKTRVGADVGQIGISNGLAYWTASSASSGTVQRCGIGGCGGGPLDVISGQPNAYGLVVSGGQLAFGVRQASGVVRRSTPSGSGVVDLLTLDSPTGLATDGVNLYAASRGSNTIAKCPLTGCAPSAQATLALADNPHTVATDRENVYWTNGLADGRGSIAWCPSDGCSGKGNVLAANQNNPFTVAVDEEAVYWTNSVPNGQVMKVARP